MKYMLDTNICIYRQHFVPSVVKRMNECAEGDLVISSVVYAELLFGIENSTEYKKNYEKLQEFLTFVDILEFDIGAAENYGSIRACLESTGNRIGDNDLFIAAHALSLGLPLVTNNTREFERVPGLKLENWFEQTEQTT